MDAFIGRPGVFLPKVILVDKDGRHIETTNRTKLPQLEKFKKSSKLNYAVREGDTPLTNPAEIAETLEDLYGKSDRAGICKIAVVSQRG